MRLCYILLASMMASASFGQTLTVATFNAEFLYPSKVHLKYGLEYRMSDNTPEQQQEWEQPGFRMQKYEEAVVRVAELLAQIETDVLTLSEVGDEDELSFLVEALHDQGVEYEHVAVCSCSEASRWTYEFRGELNQIDHILVSYSLRRTQTSSIRTRVIEVPQQTTPRISDHRPIVVTMELP